ncbi:GNAT family N-acetyltransferase [Paenibacillus kobensis]|uniref:GNAT family N-acetyltransferase n=1 Tax=Paenibacillus kobensis TaxID=59841 RepID=UPI000FD9F6BF|nr:GNAT family N-acetyltransferase [Paenibacillus kobensis]
MLNMRKAVWTDHEFLVRVDLKNEGYTVSSDDEMTEQELVDHSNKIKPFLTDSDKGAFIIEDSNSDKSVATIMYSIVNRNILYPWTIYEELDPSLFQSDGRFLEIFQLWVHPSFRRLGLATALKQKLEEEARYHQVDLIYTHTEETNLHVIELNRKMGYQTVRRGPIWDEVIRISLIKKINTSIN